VGLKRGRLARSNVGALAPPRAGAGVDRVLAGRRGGPYSLDRVALVALLIAHLAAGATSAAAQGVVRAARLTVDVARSDVSVRAEYELALEGDAGFVEVELLEHEGATNIVVLGPGGGPLDLRTASGTRRTGTVDLASAAVGGAAAGGAASLTFRYDVPGAVRLEGGAVLVRVPVLSVSLPPAADAGDVFSATVRVPEGWTVSEGFPSGLRGDGLGGYTTTLPVVPSMVSVRGRSDGTWRPSVNLIVEILAGTFLLGFALLGWRHLGGGAA
jgi:hypothetical protein